MDIIDALVKRLVENEDLIKDATSRRVQKMIAHLKSAKNKSLSPQQRQHAYEQAKRLIQASKESKSKHTKVSNLDKLLAASKSKTATDADNRLTYLAAKHNIKLPKKNASDTNSQAQEALDQVGKLHSMGDTDSAHELYNAIPNNLLPKNMQDYNPAYMHYGVHPEMWSQMPDPAHRQEMHNIHKQALAGELDNHPDYAHIVPKVKSLKAPKPQM
jgi:hypothetical protein